MTTKVYQNHPIETAAAPGEERQPKRRTTLSGDALIILPLRNTVLFPSTVTPLTFGRASSIQAVEEAVRQELPIGVVAQRDPKIEAPQPRDLYQLGTVASILHLAATKDGQRHALVQGRQRFKIVDFLQTEPFPVARFILLEEVLPKTTQFEAQILHLRQESRRAPLCTATSPQSKGLGRDSSPSPGNYAVRISRDSRPGATSRP